MNTQQYQEFVQDTSTPGPEGYTPVFGALGLCGEAGEVAEVIKEHWYRGDVLDHVDLQLELGDVLWYLTYLCNIYGFTIEEVMQKNVAKLNLRRNNVANGIL